MPGLRAVKPLGFVAVVGIAYAALATWLPESTPVASTQAGTTPAGGTIAPIPTDIHVCGANAKAMLHRFQAAIEEQRGAVHEVVDLGTAQAVPGQLNVGLRPGADAAAVAARHGLRLVRDLPRLGVATLALSSGAVDGACQRLALDPAVRFAEPNLTARVALRPNDPFHALREAAGARNAGVEAAWDFSTGRLASGAGVVVALLDTGVDPNHPDLRGRLLPGYDFVNRTTTLADDNGHGTAMAGIIAATGQNGEGVIGVAFEAQLLPVKVADALGVASVADVAAGIDFALSRGARVINLSMGTPVGARALEDAVGRALAAGVVVVASAGNDPVHHEQFPAGYPGVVSATVTGPEGELPFEAVIAEGVDVGCPTEETISTLPGGVYGFVGGTSSAAAFASGVAALVIAKEPALTGAQVAQVLRQAQDPIPALAELEGTLRFGRLNAQRAVARASAAFVDVAVTGLRTLPRKPKPGQAAVAVVEVENQGSVVVSGAPVAVERRDPSTGATIALGSTSVTLQVGERRELRFAFTAPAAGSHRLLAAATERTGEAETTDNRRELMVTTSAVAEHDLRVVARTTSAPDLAAGTITATATLENRGTEPLAAPVVDGEVTLVRSTTQGPSAREALGQQVAPTLAPGARATVSFTWRIPTPAPTGIVRVSLAARPAPGEVRTDDNTVHTHLALAGAGPLSALYQQSNGVDIIPDAPWRLDPNRPYVPVQVFVPSKGGRTPSTTLKVTRAEVILRDTPTGPGTTLYDDAPGAPPTTQPQGLQLVDELGQARATNDLFGDRVLDMNGHHDILRLPRAALGVPAAPAAMIEKFIDITIRWEQRQALFFGFSTTRTGRHRAVCRVRFSTAAFPALPGENHYHDVHHHTIAEWAFGSPLDVFSPRKAYGGPLQMVFECAYAYGIIDQPTQQAAWGKLITTDHSSFNNRTIPDPDGPDHRPPFGPQSPSQNAAGAGQLEAYRRIFGPTAGEEIAFKQDVPVPHINIPYVNNILNVLPGVPIGAHMLLYHADHVEGPWHGGGFLRSPMNPNIDVNLFPLLNDLAKNRQPSQGSAFIYAAHPFSGMGWNDSNLQRGWGLDPRLRTRDEVHDASSEFVLKGLEWFNGRGTRSLPTSQIDFEDLNPWSDPTFARGAAGWDKGVWVGLTRWHDIISKTLDYAFVSEPEVRFIRKIYQSGGSDAHGDFNFSTGRAATPLSVQSTYSVGDEAWYGVRTYCFGDGKPGATAQDRWMAAYADGNSVVTDGPLLRLSLDAERRFDSARRVWHDRTQAAEDDDGRLGGGGPLDGAGTALVRRGSDAPAWRYRYSSTAEWGPVAAALLYKTEAGTPNPTRTRGNFQQIVGVNRLALTGADQDLTQPLDPTKEGPVTKLTAFAAGAFTGGDPDQVDLGVDDYRCYTNPLFCVPYDVEVKVNTVDAATATIPVGGLEATFTFDISMDPAAHGIEVKGLDANGDSTDLSQPFLSLMIPSSGTGWSDRPGIKDGVLTVVNRDPIPVSGAHYPGANRVTFVVYWKDAPRDAAGNALNPIATTFESAWHPAPPPSATTAAPATAGNGAASTVAPGGGGGGGGCALATSADPANPANPAGLAGLALVALLALRRRRAAGSLRV